MTRPHPSRGTVVLLGAMTAFGAMSTDMYLPSLPALAADLHASAPAAARTVSIFFLGMGVGQLVWGPLSDRFGRRPPLLAGIGLYVAASALCAFAPSIAWLTAARLAQALGGCAGFVISRAIVRDRYAPEDTAKILSLLMLVMGLAPILAPLAGGYLVAAAGWRAVFWVLLGFGAAVGLAVLFRLDESRSAATADTARGETALASYAALLRDRRLLGYLGTSSLNSACLFAYITESPSLIITHFGVPPERFGWVFGANAFGLVAMSQVNRWLLNRASADRILAVASPAVAVFAAVLLTCAATGFGGMWGVLVPLFLIISTFGLTGANTTAGGLERAPSRAGTVSSLFGACSMALGAGMSALASLFHDGTPVPMAALILVCALGAAASLFILALPRGRASG